jgi:biopolymer transport protein ExbD
MAMSGGKDDGSPMMEMNTTPLIDVMLVLLIMFIITIPVATHAVNIDLPSPNPPPTDVHVDPIKNKVVLTYDNKVLWNGQPVNNGQFVALLQQTLQIKPEPELQFQPEAGAGYELASAALNIIKGSGVTKFGFVGNEQYSEFGKAPNAGKATP